MPPWLENSNSESQTNNRKISKYCWTHIYEADNHLKYAVSRCFTHNKQQTHCRFFLKLFQTSRSTFPGSQCSRGGSLFGRLRARPTHPYYDMINLFFSCWGGGSKRKKEVELAKQMSWDRIVRYEGGRKKEEREIWGALQPDKEGIKGNVRVNDSIVRKLHSYFHTVLSRNMLQGQRHTKHHQGVLAVRACFLTQN